MFIGRENEMSVLEETYNQPWTKQYQITIPIAFEFLWYFND